MYFIEQRLVSVVGDDEEMQSDAASYRFEGSGSYQHRKNDDDGFSDDEDINVGGGSGGSGDYEEDRKCTDNYLLCSSLLKVFFFLGTKRVGAYIKVGWI